MKMLAAKMEIMKKQHGKKTELLKPRMEMMIKKDECEEATITTLNKVSQMLDTVNNNLKISCDKFSS